MDFQERKKYNMNGRTRWYLGIEDGEHMFVEFERTDFAVIYPVKAEDITRVDERSFTTTKEPCYILDRDTPPWLAFEPRRDSGGNIILEDTPFLQLVDSLPKEALEGLAA